MSQLAQQIKNNIMNHELTIYDEIEVGDTDFWFPANEMEYLLTAQLAGCNLNGLALRTRSKVVKTQVCEALGYPVPKSFKKTQPRFLCQKFDVYTQKSNNLQIWNEEISPSRRYVLIRISESDLITQVKVVTGDILAKLDTTGKLTQKYQARYSSAHIEPSKLLSLNDTEFIQSITQEYNNFNEFTSPASDPQEEELMPIDLIFNKLKPIVGKTIPYIGATQERNRGGYLHKLICEALGYNQFRDNGEFPDVKHQLLEVKLQTSQTIDLGLFLPSNTEPLDIPQIKNQPIHMSDVRYAIFFGNVINNEILINHFYLVTGQDFFYHFTQFGGKKINKKLQIPLPATFWYE